ncbi:MAG: hypothetical protein KDA84_18225, partial [Planctomycetaceae bacterium]|nr:hypothetical protein [Planctomycetaceae bacterium]
MPIIFRCQECDARLTVSNKDAGKRMRCPSCESLADVPELPTKQKPSREPRTESRPRPETYTESPARSERRSRPQPQPRRERPRNRPEFRPRARGSEDSGSSSPLLIPGLIGGGLLLVVVVGVGAFLMGRSETTPDPQETTVAANSNTTVESPATPQTIPQSNPTTENVSSFSGEVLANPRT